MGLKYKKTKFKKSVHTAAIERSFIQSREEVNSSATSHGGSTPSECQIFTFLGDKIDQSTPEAYTVIIFIIVISIITFPVTTVLNLLVVIAVKTKPRLKATSNIALGCLAVTDGLIGVIGQVIFISARISTILAETTSDFCTLQRLSRTTLRLLGGATMLHLVLINVERYIAIKNSLQYISMVTKARVLGSSLLAWITAVLLTIPSAIASDVIYINVNNILLFVCLAIIIYCQVEVYRETRRHEKQMATQQVSEEAKQKFLKEKKALK